MKTTFTYLLLTGIAIALLFSSCQTSSLSLGTARTTEVNGAVIHTPILVDVSVQSKDSAVYTYNNNTGNTPSDEQIQEAKSSCLYALLTKTNSDEIIEPSFDVKTEGSKFTVKVKGFPAKYKNFRMANNADTSIIKMYKYLSYNQVSTGQAGANITSNKNNKNAGGIAVVVLLLAGAAIAIGAIAAH